MGEKKTNLPIYEDISEKEFDEILKDAFERSKRGEGKEASVVFAEIRKKIAN